MSRFSQLSAALAATSALVLSTSMASAAVLPPRPAINIVVPRPAIVVPVRPIIVLPTKVNVAVPAKLNVVAVAKPTSVTTAMFGGKEVTKTTYIKGNEDTVIFTNQSGEVVGAISSITEPVSSRPPVTVPASAGNAGATQPYNQYPSTGITPANAWNAGASQPYNQYPSAGITPANAWNAGASQPYNQYHNVISQ